MCRKLNALEEIQASSADHNAGQQDGRARLRQQLLERIADTLGITTAQLSEPPTPPSEVRPAIDLVQRGELVLTQQCTDLIEAFVQIQDPQDRLRCLEIVRAAAGVKSPGSAL